MALLVWFSMFTPPALPLTSRDLDPARNALGLWLFEIDRQQAVFQFRNVDRDAVGNNESALKLPRGNAAMEILALDIVLLLTANHQLVFLEGDFQVLAREAGDGKGDSQPFGF